VPFELGQVQIVQVEETVWIANLIGQHGIKRQGGNPPIRYEAIREGLRGVAAEAIAKNAAVHMPRIGCGLAGGSWEKIESIIRTELTAAGVPVFVYDFPGS
jgi:O-acetyl-ADP-ribose deacetylase (regulator of RNase III)